MAKRFEMCEELEHRFSDLEAFVVKQLGNKEVEALSKIIHLCDESDANRIIYDDEYSNYWGYYFKRYKMVDFIDAYLILFQDEERTEKNELLEAFYYRTSTIDNEDEIKDALTHVFYEEKKLKRYLEREMAKKYYKYFTLDFVKEFLGL